MVLNSCSSLSRAGGQRARPLDAVSRSGWKAFGRFIFPAGPLGDLAGGEACPVETGAQGRFSVDSGQDIETLGWGCPPCGVY